jgi:hypothetical protein
MRVCLLKSNGKIIESQSGGETQDHLNTLMENAIRSGYLADQVEVKHMDDAEFEALFKQQQAAGLI